MCYNQKRAKVRGITLQEKKAINCPIEQCRMIQTQQVSPCLHYGTQQDFDFETKGKDNPISKVLFLARR